MTISFSCPSCSAQMQFSETDAGQSGPCFQCGTIVTVPHRVPETVPHRVPETVAVACARCSTVTSFPASLLGQSGPCPACRATMTVTQAVQAPPARTPVAQRGGPQTVAPNKTQVAVLERIQKEALKCRTEVLGSKVLQIGDDVSTSENVGEMLKASFLFGGNVRTDRVLIAKLRITFANNLTAFLVVPCSGGMVLAHEFASLVPGTLPSSLVLERSMLGGRWSGSDGGESDRFAKLADRDSTLSAGINWDWEVGRTRIKLHWGLQAMPILPNKMLHIVHTAEQGIVFRDYGIRWYAERHKAFSDFVAKQLFDGQVSPPAPKHSPLSLLVLDDILSE